MSRSYAWTHRFHWHLAIAAVLLAACGGDAPTGPAGVVDSVVLNVASVELELEDTTRLVAQARDASGNVVSGVRFTWTSSNPNVATVSTDGLVTAVDLGDAEIAVDVAPAASRTGALQREVPSLAGSTQNPTGTRVSVRILPRVVITPGPTNVDLYGSVSYTAAAYGRNGAALRVDQAIWTSSDTAVATIDSRSGQALTRATGTTQIRAHVFVGGPGLSYNHEVRTRPVALHVTFCGGIDEVEEWEAEVSMTYGIVANTVSSGGDPAYPTAWIMNQQSTATATLSKTVGTGASHYYQGRPTGTFKIHNSMTQPTPDSPPVVNTEDGEGGMPVSQNAAVTLHIFRSGGQCVFEVRYQDWMRYTQVIHPFGAIPPVDGSGGVGRTGFVPFDPAAGPRWELRGEKQVPGYVAVNPFGSQPEGDVPPGQAKTGYWLITPLGMAMFGAQQDRHAAFGQATIKFTLKAK